MRILGRNTGDKCPGEEEDAQKHTYAIEFTASQISYQEAVALGPLLSMTISALPSALLTHRISTNTKDRDETIMRFKTH